MLVGVKSSCGLEGSGFESRQGRKIFSSPKPSISAPETYPNTYSMGTGFIP